MVPEFEDPSEEAIFQACLACAAQAGWEAFSFEQVAEQAALPLGAINALFPSKEAFLLRFFAYIDRKARDHVCLEGLETLKEQVFELILTRFEVLAPYKKWCQGVYEASFTDPRLACAVSRKVKTYIKFMEEVSFGEAPACAQALAMPALFGLYLLGFRQWLQDESADSSATLAFLDNALTYILPFLQILQQR
jgi:AcrR family transcriptional regulator